MRLSVRFVPDRRLPDKALDLLDEACADASLGTDGNTVDAARVARVVSERTSIPVHTLTEAEREAAQAGSRRSSSARVIGQGEAVGSSRRPRGCAVRDGSGASARVFLFAGSSGVGKTELARALADFLFPEGQALVKLDMSRSTATSSPAAGCRRAAGLPGHGEEWPAHGAAAPPAVRRGAPRRVREGAPTSRPCSCRCSTRAW
ncbi:MAG: hypothetical protein R3F59_26180 [Myxococcota bacterium]